MNVLAIFSSLFLIFVLAANADWPADTKPFAQATLLPRSGSRVSGTVDFAKSKDGLMIRVYADNLSPGPHGIHLHEKGDCSADDAATAGEHYNPTAAPHRGPKHPKRHAGDFGNLTAGKDGVAKLELTIATPKEKTFPGWDDILQKAIVIHEKADDLKTQPSGNSGKRIACGVVESTATPAAPQ